MRVVWGSIATSVGLSLGLAACGSSTPAPEPAPTPAAVRPSRAKLNTPAPVEKLQIDVGAQRSGHSLVVNVHTIAKGHKSGQALEDPEAWLVSASYKGSPLRQVLAGPAKVSRAPTGAAMGDQWDIEVKFMVAFALPDRAGDVEVKVQAPNGERANHKLFVEAPAERLTDAR